MPACPASSLAALSSGCLAGVTRDLVVAVAGVEERPIPMAALAGAEELFLTSSIREIQPIARLDGTPLPATPGPLTTTAMAAYAELIGRNPDP